METKAYGNPSEGPRALITLLTELAIVYPELILTQGSDRWPIEDLLMQARQDRYGPDRKAIEAPLYGIVRDADGKVSIQNLKSGSIAFSEAGAVKRAPTPSI